MKADGLYTRLRIDNLIELRAARVGHIARLRRVGKRPSAARAFAIKSIDECPECLWLWQRHNGLERQRIAVRVMPIGYATDHRSVLKLANWRRK